MPLKVAILVSREADLPEVHWELKRSRSESGLAEVSREKVFCKVCAGVALNL
jgi:hypothetical protein